MRLHPGSLVAVLLLCAGGASAATYTVINTADSGAGSLRQAILDANASPGADTIAFNIPGSGVHTITLSSQLPDVTESATIDGYTQPGASVNTLGVGDDAVILIEIDGTQTSGNGLTLTAGSSTVRGLCINRFTAVATAGVHATGGSGHVIEGNFIGTDPTGTIKRANLQGVRLVSGNNTVGGPAAANRNILSGNNFHGVNVVSSGNVIQGNYIGVDASGVSALGNSSDGVFFFGAGATSNTLGGVTSTPGSPPGNLIAFNGTSAGAGVAVVNSGPGSVTVQGNVIKTNGTPASGGVGVSTIGAGGPQTVLSNLIFDNFTLGIDLDSNGVTPNTPLSPRNYPVLNSAVSSGGTTTIQGTLNSAANQATVTIEFFSNGACDPSGYGEGETLVGTTTVSTDMGGNASFSVVVTPMMPIGNFATATATVPGSGTSEFSACRIVTNSLPTLTPTPTLTPSLTPTPTPTPTPSMTSTSTRTPTLTITPTSTSTPTITPSPTPMFQIILIAPKSGAAIGGSSVVVSGSGFQAGGTLAIGGVPATGVNVVGATEIDAVVPALPPGTLDDVTVTNPARPSSRRPSSSSATLAAGWLADFLDVGQGDNFHSYVEKVFRNGITAGCGGGNYCRDNSVTRAQMAVFLLKAKHGPAYLPPQCTGSFLDVACPGTFADWIEELATEGITGGCGGDNYCPNNPVTRQQMAVFLLKTEHGAGFVPAPCMGIFGDVLCPGTFTDWIEQLFAENVTGGCSTMPLLYCPTAANTRGQMAVFITKTFNLP